MGITFPLFTSFDFDTPYIRFCDEPAQNIPNTIKSTEESAMVFLHVKITEVP
jgi:hypothetical protein